MHKYYDRTHTLFSTYGDILLISLGKINIEPIKVCQSVYLWFVMKYLMKKALPIMQNFLLNSYLQIIKFFLLSEDFN